LKSPIFVAFPGSPWRSRVVETWQYLQKNYDITVNKRCGTHIHISVEGGYGFEEIKQIAKAALWFEPAFDALVPLHRTGGKCGFAKNLWLNGNHLAIDNKSRLDCCHLIDTVKDYPSFVDIINQDMSWYSWNFRSIERFYTVEFRKPPACKTADETLAWAEIAMTFVQSSIRYGYTEILQTIPSTVGGLRSFLEQSNVDGLNEPQRFQAIFGGKDPNSFLETTPLEVSWMSDDMWLKFESKIKADKKRVRSLEKITREQNLY
jgi:hypothetical protein